MKHAELVSDDLWEAIAPFLPKEPPKPSRLLKNLATALTAP
jgi:hypothetical protein